MISLNDPLVPLGVGAWFERVFRVLRRQLGRLVVLACAPALVAAAYLVALVAALPTEERIQARIDEVGRGVGPPVSPMVEFFRLFGPAVATLLVFLVLLVLVVSGFLRAAFFLVVREANGQPTTVGGALGFARSGSLRLAGWILLVQVVELVALLAPMSLGLALGVDWLILVGALVGLTFVLGILAVAVASLTGVVVVERAGPRRAVRLARGSFWVAGGRLAVAGVAYLLYVGAVSPAAKLAPPTIGTVTAGTVLGAVVQALLLIPPLVFAAGVSVVSYAELRFRENHGVGTRTLAAELSG